MRPRPIYDLPLPTGGTLRLGPRTLVMGIVNVTPDSFADAHDRADGASPVERALEMVASGADLLDIGGESTRPGATPIATDEELSRVLPVIRALAGRVEVPISVDTSKADVAWAALAEGASIVNDISALRYDPGIAEAVAQRHAVLILMHSRGRSNQMYREAEYQDVAGDVAAELDDAIRRAQRAGVPREAIVVDPGLGFAKRSEHTYAALAGLDALARLDRPILVGPSRKSFLTLAVGDVPPSDREWATAGAVATSILLGAHIVRVHGVRAMVDVARVADRVRSHAEAHHERDEGVRP